MGKKPSHDSARLLDIPQPLPLPELADALQAQAPAIVDEWCRRVQEGVPAARDLPFGELQDNVPDILSKMADALRATDARSRAGLLERAPLQGITRFQQHYDIPDLMTEDRMLRRVVIERVEAALGHLMTQPEQLALNTAIDVMLQQAVVAFVEHQSGQLRLAAESELKYLSFLSHDLNNHLSNITVWLQVLRAKLINQPQFQEEVETIDTAQQAILTTIGGMGKLLQAERLRKGGKEPKAISVDLRTLIANETRQVIKQAERKGLAITVDVPKDVRLVTDPELISLVLQNLMGNAVKYSGKGTIRVRGELHRDSARERWRISVQDEGPGIAPELRQKIFQAFRRGDIHGQTGVGLGLAIAAQAARLLGAELTVESEVDVGSTFTLWLPGE